MSTDDQMKLQPVPGATADAQSAPNAPNATDSSNSHESDLLPSDLFEDQFEFIDDIHGQISLNRIERDVIDSPEFQRLFRLSQLGFVDLVYPTANHTRAVHSIGACHVAKNLVNLLNRNNSILKQKGYAGSEVPTITTAEKVLISLGGFCTTYLTARSHTT